MRSSRNRVIGAALVALALVAAACGSGGDVADGPTIRVTSFNFNESNILAEIYAQALEDAGYPVERQLNLGSREIVKEALVSGEVDLVPEYVGTLLAFLGGEPTADSQSTYDQAKELFEQEGVTLLDFAEAQDKNAYVVTQATADQYSLTTVSDLQPVAGDLKFGGPPECPEREACLLGLMEVYGLEFAEFVPLDVAGPLTIAALEGGEIDVALLFSTQGIVADRGFIVLDDDQGLNPAENIVPAVRQEIVDAYGDDFVDLLNDINSRLDTPGLTALNSRADIDQEDPADVAREWLIDEGIIDG